MDNIGRFSTLSEDKVQILQKFLQSDDIVKCLVSNDDNFLSENISNLDRTTLLYNNLWPYKFTPEIVTEPKTYITIASRYVADGKTYRRNSLRFHVITHKKLISTDFGLRHDYLIDKIDEIFYLNSQFNSSRFRFTDMDEYHADSAGNWIVASIGYTSLKI